MKSKKKSSGIISRFVDIRPHERVKAFLMFFYFFSIIATIWMLKPVRNSLFIDELGAENLRYVYMGEGVFLIAVVWFFVQFSKRVSRKMLYNGVLLFFIACLIGFWLLFRMQIPYLSAFFYVWAASYSVLMTTQFFILANDIFNPLEARRLFGFILSGGSIGGVLGGILTQQLVGVLGTENLLLAIAAVIGICNVLVTANWKHLSSESEEKQSVEAEKKGAASPDSGRKLLMGSTYLMALAGIIMIAKMASAVVDNQFNAMVEVAISGRDARTAFFGGFFSFLNALSFVMQLFVTSIVLRYLGVGTALWILPIGLLLGSAGTLVYPLLGTALFLKAFDGSANYSIQQASKEVLYLPIPSAIRYKVKPVIDMLGYRIAKSLGGVYIAIAAPLLGLSDIRLSVLVLCLLPLWFFLVWRMQKGYSNMLRQNLLSQAAQETEPKRATDVLGALHAEKNWQSIKPLTRHPSPYARKLASLTCFLYERSGKKPEEVRQTVQKLLHREALEVAEQGPRQVSRAEDEELEKLESMIFKITSGTKESSRLVQDFPEESLLRLGEIIRNAPLAMETRRRAVRLLELMPRQETVDLLLACLAQIQDHGLRYMVSKSLNRLHERNAAIKMNRFLIKGEITREVKIMSSIESLTHSYKENQQASDQTDYLEMLLRSIHDESFERIFLFLNLLYPQEKLQIIHDRLIETGSRDPLHAHAIELLQNTLDRDILRLVRPVLEETEMEILAEEEIVALLRDFLSVRDQWYFLSAYYLAAALDLMDHPELKPYLAKRSEFLPS